MKTEQKNTHTPALSKRPNHGKNVQNFLKVVQIYGARTTEEWQKLHGYFNFIDQRSFFVCNARWLSGVSCTKLLLCKL